MRLETRLLKLTGVLAILFVAYRLAIAQNGQFNSRDNTLIADEFNNREVEVDRRGNIVWHFGLGPNDFSPASIIGVNDAQRVCNLTLMSGTGIPGGSARSARLHQSQRLP